MNVCDKCGKPLCAADENLHLVEMVAGPTPECPSLTVQSGKAAPEGYGCEVSLCERCYLIYHEGLDQVDRE